MNAKPIWKRKIPDVRIKFLEERKKNENIDVVVILMQRKKSTYGT
jgi:hypothetical protein